MEALDYVYSILIRFPWDLWEFSEFKALGFTGLGWAATYGIAKWRRNEWKKEELKVEVKTILMSGLPSFLALILFVLLAYSPYQQYKQLQKDANSSVELTKKLKKDNADKDMEIERLKEKTLYNLEGTIEQYYIQEGSFLDPKTKAVIEKNVLFVYVQMSLTNLGMPSIARAFGGAVESDAGLLPGASMIVDEGHVVKGAGNKMTLRASDILYEKSEAMPIPKGGMIRGWLLFTFPGSVFKERIISPTAKLLIYFSDVRGNKYTSGISLKDHKKPYVLRHFSGGPPIVAE